MIKHAAALMQGASFVLIPASGHSPCFEHADAFNRVVADFLDGPEVGKVPERNL